MKKFYLLFLISIHTIASIASSTIDGINYYLVPSNTIGYSVVAEGDYNGKFVIPSYIYDSKKRKYEVRGWALNAFTNCDNLTSIELGAKTYDSSNYYTVSISNQAFEGCNHLMNIYVNSSNNYFTSIDGVLYSKDKSTLRMFPTGRTGSFSIPDYVSSVGSMAFKYTNLEELTIPNSLYNFDDDFLGDCTKLTSIKVSESNSRYSSLNGVLYNKSQTAIVRYPVGKKGNVTIDKNIGSIQANAFAKCEIDSFICNPNTKSIDLSAFDGAKIKYLYLDAAYSNYKFLEKLDESSTVYVHYYEYDKAKKYFSGKLKTIEKYYVKEQTEKLLGRVSFAAPANNCMYYDSTAPGAQQKPWNGYILKSININGQDIEATKNNTFTIDGLLPDKNYVIKFTWEQYMFGKVKDTEIEIDSVKTASYNIGFSNNTGDTKCGINYISLKVIASSDESLSASEIGCYCYETDKYYKANDDGIVRVQDLHPYSNYQFHPYAIYREVRHENKSYKRTIRTDALLLEKAYTCTQTTIKISSISFQDRSGNDTKPTSCGVEYDGKRYPFTGKDIVLTNLKTNTDYWITFYAVYNGKDYYTGSTIKTLSVNPSFTVASKGAGPTSLHLIGSYNLGDAKLKKCYFQGYANKGIDLVITGLQPGKAQRITFVVETEDGGIEKYTANKSTEKLSFESLTPKVVGNNSAIVCSKTNILDEETNVGFEWRKLDAPEIVPSKQGYGVVFNGILEGRINDLTASAYYKARPFYKDKDGNTYYGEWKGFDPSDYSYFAPTVHTYASYKLEASTAFLRGCVLQGTDNIIEQGFEYWEENAIDQSATRSSTGVKTIVATGQKISATITNLMSETTYSFRAYAKTEKGITYGETCQFSTPVTSGINNLATNATGKISFNVKGNRNIQIVITGASKDKCHYRITSLNGNIVEKGSVPSDGNWHSIGCVLNSGIYIISITDANDRISKKLFVD